MPRLDGSHEIIAHRGFSARAPENTLSAMDAAISAGADALEWDVQVAACGTPVLFHDSHLGRTSNGVGPLRRRVMCRSMSVGLRSVSFGAQLPLLIACGGGETHAKERA